MYAENKVKPARVDKELLNGLAKPIQKYTNHFKGCHGCILNMHTNKIIAKSLEIRPIYR